MMQKLHLPAIPGNISVANAAFHGETGQTYAVVVAVKTSTGAAYNGTVNLTFDDKDAVVGTPGAGYRVCNCKWNFKWYS